MNTPHEPSIDVGLAPGLDDNPHMRPWQSVRTYFIGLVLSALLTGAAFYFVQSKWLWEPGIPVALSVLAVAQIGVHLAFFLHLTTGQDNVNNTIALAFGTLIVTLVIGGTLWIMYNMNLNMPMMTHMSSSSSMPNMSQKEHADIHQERIKIETRPKVSGKIRSISCEIGAVVKKGQICAIIEVADLELNLSVAQKALHASQEYLQHEEASLLTSQAILEQTRTKTSSRAKQLKLQIDATRMRLASEKNKIKLLEKSGEDVRRKAEESQIIAPIDGIVLTKDLQIGEMVSPNSLKPIFVFTSQP